ncbi:hypothetical protein PISMIDRAFT_685334, partial [Pisolithus microcarpus 441]
MAKDGSTMNKRSMREGRRESVTIWPVMQRQAFSSLMVGWVHAAPPRNILAKMKLTQFLLIDL